LPGCNRRARVQIIPIAKKMGYYAQVETVASKLKCNHCGRKGVEAKWINWKHGINTGWRPGDR
jgi:hypothetical protein